MSTTFRPSPDGDQNKGDALFGVALATVIVALIAVTLRIFVRARIVRSLGWDDWIIVLAISLALTSTGTEIAGIDHGLGRHEFYLSPPQRQRSAIFSAISQAFCIMALTFCKLSICISFLRILQGAHVAFAKLFLYTIAGLVLVVNIAFVITLFVQCQPIGKIWNPKVSGECWKPTVERAMNYLQGVVSALTDFLLSAFPIYVFKNLHVDKKSKYVLCVLMGLGCITGIFAIVRTAYVGPYAEKGDPSYTTVNLLIWAALERNIAIAIACIPATRPLLHSFVRLTSSKESRHRNRQGYVHHSDEGYKLESKVSGVKVERTFGATISDSNHSNAGTSSFAERLGSEERILPVLPQSHLEVV